jgi:hypothetical protein
LLNPKSQGQGTKDKGPISNQQSALFHVLASLIFENLRFWPLSAALGCALTAALLWLYPAQIRGAGMGKWLPLLLRWLAVAALSLSLLKPVILRPKSAEQWGAVVFLVDCSKSMSVVDPGRTPAELVALAGALGRLPPGTRSEIALSLAADIANLETRAREVVNGQSDLDYARVSGRGIEGKQANLQQYLDRYGQAAAVLAVRSHAFPEGSGLKQRLLEIGTPPAKEARDIWADEVKRQMERLRAAVRAFQTSADEQLYKENSDVRTACNAVAKLSRLELTEDALIHPDTGLVYQLEGNIPAIGLAMDRGLSLLSLTANGHPVAALSMQANAKESDIAGAVATAMNGLSGRAVRAVVLLSDGRQVGGRGDVMSGLRPSGVPVFTIGVAADRTPDVALNSVSLSATSAFAGETIEGEATVVDDGGIKAPAELHITTSSGEQIERLSPRARRDRRERGREWVSHFAIAVTANDGQAAERIVFSVPESPGEASVENNRVERWVKVSSNKLKVAVCTAAPTWDFQYLRSTLSSRPWVRLESQVLDPEHPKLGLTPGQILDQDVLILSDVPVGALNVNQWDAVHTLVTTRGGSVVLVAGTSYPFADYALQPIAKALLPFHDVRPTWKEWPGEQPAFHFTPTPQGERQMLRLGESAEGDERRWQDLPGVFRFLQIPDRNIYPDVQRLLIETESQSPVLTERRLGAGRAFFLALNETWRWRLKSGDREADQFWRQLVRHAAGEPYAVSNGPLALDVDRVVAQPGEAFHVRARTRGGKVASRWTKSYPLDVLQNGKVISTRELAPVGAGHFGGAIGDLPEGDYQFQLRSAASITASSGTSSPVVRLAVHVADSDEAEMRDLSGDPTLLTRIARSSGGEYLPIEQVDRLPRRLNALHETESQFARTPLWNSPVFFGFILACFAGEWALRKRFGLA